MFYRLSRKRDTPHPDSTVITVYDFGVNVHLFLNLLGNVPDIPDTLRKIFQLSGLSCLTSALTKQLSRSASKY